MGVEMIKDVGDTGLLVSFEQTISTEISTKVLALRSALQASEEKKRGYIQDLVPSYCALLVIYNPQLMSYLDIKRLIINSLSQIGHLEMPQGRQVELSVDYSVDYGLDQDRIMAHTGLSMQEIIKRHTEQNYQVYMLGFLAGFPYLGGMDQSLATPRLDSPRTAISPGSVGIAGGQTGVYTVTSPGGWNILGRTHHLLFDPSKKDPFLLEAGDRLKFIESNQPHLKITGEKTNPLALVADSNEIDRRPVFEVVQQGMLTTVQDYGRYGYLSFGISSAGVMDKISYRYLLALLEENLNETLSDSSLAVLEWVVTGPILKATADGIIALGGSVEGASINEQAILPWQVYAIKAGDLLKLGQVAVGLRGYLAIKGGFLTEVVLGSRSADKQNGLCNQSLEKGSYLLGRVASEKDFELVGRRCNVPAHLESLKQAVSNQAAVEVGVVFGPQSDYFTEEGITHFLNEAWTTGQQMNRMGIRLDGSPIAMERASDIISDGINLGAIQVSGNQLPMIMLNDRQTVGGYAKIGNVIEADMSLLGQIGPNMKLRFKAMSVSEAHELLFTAYKKPTIFLSRENLHLASRLFNIKVNRRVFLVEVVEIN